LHVFLLRNIVVSLPDGAVADFFKLLFYLLVVFGSWKSTNWSGKLKIGLVIGFGLPERLGYVGEPRDGF
jgi:hypothetical protein